MFSVHGFQALKAEVFQCNLFLGYNFLLRLTESQENLITQRRILLFREKHEFLEGSASRR